MTARATRVCLSLSVELMVSPISHHAEQAARNTSQMETQMFVNDTYQYSFIISGISLTWAPMNET